MLLSVYLSNEQPGAMSSSQSAAVADNASFAKSLLQIVSHISDRHAHLSSLSPASSPAQIASALSAVPSSQPARGLGLSQTVSHLLNDIGPALPQAHNGPRNFSLVTGGTTPAAQLADMLVTSYDENLFVHFRDSSASVALEQRTLEMILDLLDLPRAGFKGRTMTTGATASNVLGLGQPTSICTSAATDLSSVCKRPSVQSFARHNDGLLVRA